jgi:acyl carrier protein
MKNQQEFIQNFASQFDETDASIFTIETRFKELDEWSSLISLAELNMIAKNYGVKLTPEEMKRSQTLQELYNLILSKKQQ